METTAGAQAPRCAGKDYLLKILALTAATAALAAASLTGASAQAMMHHPMMHTGTMMHKK